MAKTFKEILDYLVSGGSICDRYSGLVRESRTKSALAEVITDCNGIEFLTQRLSTDISANYSQIAEYLKKHINGNRIFIHDLNENSSYTSEVYIGYSGTIVARTTILGVWGSDAKITVPKGKIVEIDIDRKSVVHINLEENTSVSCIYWGEKPYVSGCTDNIKFVKGKEE